MPGAAPSPARLRVLLVEDEMMVAMLIEDMLADLGCGVVGPASRVEEAMDLLAEHEVDCAILDVNVAGTWVFPVADALKARGVPFVFSSGYGAAGVREEDRGAPVLQKPFREHELQRALQQVTQ